LDQTLKKVKITRSDRARKKNMSKLVSLYFKRECIWQNTFGGCTGGDGNG